VSAGQDRARRGLDLCLAVPVLLLLLPLLAIVAGLVLVDLGRPVLFRQQRLGRDCAPFTLIKFRSMRPPDPERGLVTDAQRITPLGRLLRAASLDELPTLWHVVRGEMSLVGPRPLLVSYRGRYDAVQLRRHELRPGITGLAQVTGRNALTWEDRFALDVWYVDHRCLAIDLRILARTLITVARRDGIAAEGAATMPEFLGSPPAPTVPAPR
jgi:lipopolysaccharide/colanic/teichoic acid biosynthesis glycosyltransferase